MAEKIMIRGVRFDSVNMDEAVEIAAGFINFDENQPRMASPQDAAQQHQPRMASPQDAAQQHQPRMATQPRMASPLDVAQQHQPRMAVPFVVHTPNSEIVQLCVEQPEYYPLINSADLIIPDGIGVVLASKILRTPLIKGKVAGCDLGLRVAEYCAENDVSVYFLGGKPGVAELAGQKLAERFPGFRLAGYRDGYFNKSAGEENDAVIEAINASGAKVLYVCLGVPAQEKWIYENKARLTNVKLCLALGGSLDVYAGTVKRAPKVFIKLGLEWFWRLLLQPTRIGRMMKLPKFLIGVIVNGNKSGEA